MLNDLKAQAYDLLRQREYIDSQISQLSRRIADLEQQEMLKQEAKKNADNKRPSDIKAVTPRPAASPANGASAPAQAGA